MTSALDHHGIESDHSPSSLARVAEGGRPIGRLLSGLAIAALIALLAGLAITGASTERGASGIEAPLDGRGKWSGYLD